jgi:uncharacterized membrane protein YozB (DUF420 family)
VLRLGLAATAISAMAFQAGALSNAGVFKPGNFFSFFTIQSNILAATTLVLTALVRREERSRRFDAVRGAAAFYMAITGVVFALLLSGHQESLDTHIAWVNFVVHTLMPIVLVADWLIDPPRHRASWRTAALWLAYPLVWFVYTLVRGSAEGWYPYPFVDVAQHGYGHVFVSGIVLLIGFALAALAFVWVGNRRLDPGRIAASLRGVETSEQPREQASTDPN